ncbi:MAG: FMN-binding protein [Planctomycetota bacterium]|nr:FMN-binding protein [Planctomycetota bacterium]
MHRAVLLAALVAASLLVLASPAPAEKKKPSLIDVAVAKAFPGAKIERVCVRLSEAERKKVGKLASQRAPKKSTTFAYVARKEGKVVGTAFFDSHIVRTKRETLMVVVTPEGKVSGVETIVFQEPPEWLAQDAFYESLSGRGQGRALILGRGLDGTTGATLTCRAVADASRRVLALHEVGGERVGRVPPAPKEGREGPPRDVVEGPRD